MTGKPELAAAMRQTLESDAAQNDFVPSAERIANAIGEAFYVWDIKTDKLEWSRGFAEFIGLDKEDERHLTGRGFESMLGVLSRDTRYGTIVSSGAKSDAGKPVAYQCIYSLSKDKSGSSPVWLEDNGYWYGDDTGRPVRAEGSVRIITERRKREEDLRRKSDFDDLTRLPNRRSLEQLINKSIESAKLEGNVVAFMILSIERIEMINEIYGFESGDVVLKTAGEIIKSRLRVGDSVCRFSGSKFGIILNNCPPVEIYDAGQRILSAISSQVMEVPGGHVSANGVIGTCFLPKHAETPSQAFHTAFKGLKKARRDSQNRIGVYFPDQDTEREYLRQATFSSEIITALDEDRIRISFQPVVGRGGKVAFHEALVRMEGTKGMSVDAQEFIDTVERLGLIRIVDMRVQQLVLQSLRKYPDAVLSMNVSHDTVLDPDWLSNLATGLVGIENGARRLIVEITESMAVIDINETSRFIKNVKALGCKVAIDDFGAGFTSFSNLKNLPIDIIKLDGNFCLGIIESEVNQVFVKVLLQLAKALNLETVVEWVEDEPSALLLEDWDVDYQQGYQFGKASMTPPWESVNDTVVEKNESVVKQAS